MLLHGYNASDGSFTGTSKFSNPEMELAQKGSSIVVDDFKFLHDVDLYVSDGETFSLVDGWEAIKAARDQAELGRLTPTDSERRAAMPPISPLQGILTLGETEWGKVLTYRDTASWAEKVVIDNAADWVRTSQNIAFFGYLLEYTDAQMDQLFIAAATVTA